MSLSQSPQAARAPFRTCRFLCRTTRSHSGTPHTVFACAAVCKRLEARLASVVRVEVAVLEACCSDAAHAVPGNTVRSAVDARALGAARAAIHHGRQATPCSQPLSALPSQLPNPALHAIAHTPWTHEANAVHLAALLGAGATVRHVVLQAYLAPVCSPRRRSLRSPPCRSGRTRRLRMPDLRSGTSRTRACTNRSAPPPSTGLPRTRSSRRHRNHRIPRSRPSRRARSRRSATRWLRLCTRSRIARSAARCS